MLSEKLDEWKKIIAGTAVFGFILSFISGIIGQVSFGIILLRAFIFAVVFAGVSFVVLLLIEQFIPELLNSENTEEDSEKSDSSVIIEEENIEEAPVSGGKLDITIEDDTEPVEELEEFESESDSPSAVPADDAEEVEAAEEVEELETAPEAAEAGGVSETSAEPAAAASAPAAKAGNGKNGALPDIGVYSDSFDAVEDASAAEGLSSIDGGSSGQAEILGGMHDTDEIVRAVKTVLKKDQEG